MFKGKFKIYRKYMNKRELHFIISFELINLDNSVN